MSQLQNKKILLCITGGIAAYKALELTRLLAKSGVQVRCLLTKAAQEFVTPLSLQSLSGNKVMTDLFDLTQEHEIGHIEAARWADLILVAPATAQSLAKAALGLSDDLLGAVLLAGKAGLAFAPAMNPTMFAHEATQKHIQILRDRGAFFLGPDSGMAACGEEGEGRLLEPTEIVKGLEEYYKPSGIWAGIHCLVTAGPTIEPIDAVRYISNYSSGKMGYALTEELIKQGAVVDLVTGPTELPPPRGANLIQIKTAQEMYDAVMGISTHCKVIIASAAVADFKVKNATIQKFKKDQMPVLELEQNPDILKELGSIKTADQILVGFAAETDDLLKNAAKKLKEKNLDLIVANDVNQEGGVFFQDQNQAVILQKEGATELPRMTKQDLAKRILEAAAMLLQAN